MNDHSADILGAAPEFRCGDATVTRVFRHRWESFAANVGRSDTGWVVTEFHQPGPGRAFGTVNAAAGHHILEARWLRRVDVAEDYIRFWFQSVDAEPHRYTEWIAWAALEFARLHRSWESAIDVLPGMIATFEAWDADSRHPSGLYWAHDLADAMEFSVSGDGFRPSINSYQFGNAVAIAAIARRAGDISTAERFERTSDELRRLVLDRLLHPDLDFFATIPLSDDGEDAYVATADAERRMPRPYARLDPPSWPEVTPDRTARELIGYLPWYFGLPGDAVDPRPALSQLSDPDGFAGPHGLRTVERRHPRYGFDVRTTAPRFLCRWNGPSWPFATSQTLTALARIARDTGDESAGAQFVELLKQYAASHLEPDGSYWLDEDLDPDTGAWLTRDWRRQHDVERASIGRDYQHSTFADVVLSGLLGIAVGDEGLTVNPLPAASAFGWFEVTGLIIAGVSVDLDWAADRGFTLSAGRETVHRVDLGPLSIPF